MGDIELKALFFRQFLVFTLVFGMTAAAVLLLYGRYHLNEPLALPADEVVFRVPARSNLSLVASELKANGYMRWPEFLMAWARWQDRTLIQAGEYRLARGETALDFLDKINNGRVILYQARFIEGWRFDQFRAELERDARLQNDIQGMDQEALLAYLGMDTGYLEGWFYPDTYNFVRGDRVSSLLRRSHQLMRQVLAEEWAARSVGLPYAGPEDALIMASIIEKETGLATERGTVAGVFVRRLQIGMRLQTDPTVIYGISDFDGNITRAHLREATPYNTYVIRGLPPTPIASPGRASIHAALHPEPGDALYFVSRGDGSHVFSATLDEHQEAVRRYQLQSR